MAGEGIIQEKLNKPVKIYQFSQKMAQIALLRKKVNFEFKPS